MFCPERCHQHRPFVISDQVSKFTTRHNFYREGWTKIVSERWTQIVRLPYVRSGNRRRVSAWRPAVPRIGVCPSRCGRAEKWRSLKRACVNTSAWSGRIQVGERERVISRKRSSIVGGWRPKVESVFRRGRNNFPLFSI